MEIKSLYVPDDMFYGKERRKFIKDWFVQNPDGRYYVNCEHRPQVKSDPDLRYLIDHGYLKVNREATGDISKVTFLTRKVDKE